jgi:hypothetical protein
VKRTLLGGMTNINIAKVGVKVRFGLEKLFYEICKILPLTRKKVAFDFFAFRKIRFWEKAS